MRERGRERDSEREGEGLREGRRGIERGRERESGVESTVRQMDSCEGKVHENSGSNEVRRNLEPPRKTRGPSAFRHFDFQRA